LPRRGIKTWIRRPGGHWFLLGWDFSFAACAIGGGRPTQSANVSPAVACISDIVARSNLLSHTAESCTRSVPMAVALQPAHRDGRAAPSCSATSDDVGAGRVPIWRWGGRSRERSSQNARGMEVACPPTHGRREACAGGKPVDQFHFLGKITDDSGRATRTERALNVD
jgi:hypothetical protein